MSHILGKLFHPMERRYPELSFLKHILNSKKSESWSRFCAEIGADLARGRFGQSDRVIACFGKWKITLDTIAVATPEGASAIYTRMRVPYINKDGFRFRICSKRFPHRVKEKLIGIQNIAVGDPEIDSRFVIQGNDESRIRRLLASPMIRQLIMSQPSIDLEIRHDRDGSEPSLPDGIDQLYFHESGVIMDFERLKSLYYLFTEIMSCLRRIGSASEDKPDCID